MTVQSMNKGNAIAINLDCSQQYGRKHYFGPPKRNILNSWVTFVTYFLFETLLYKVKTFLRYINQTTMWSSAKCHQKVIMKSKIYSLFTL